MNMQTRIRPADASALLVREAEPHEAPAIAALVHAAYTQPGAAPAPELARREPADELVAAFLADGAAHVLVAEAGGEVAGVVVLHEGDRVRSLGPLAVAPRLQGSGIGRRLVQAALHRAGPATAVRLLADAGNARAQALFVAQDFLVKEPVLLLHGMPQGLAVREGVVRRLRSTDIPACAALCKAVLGVTRTHELASPGRLRDPMVIERDGRITGYLTAPASWAANHGVAESPADLRALLVGAAGVVRAPCSLLLPARGNALLAWALDQGLRIVKPMVLMARGAYAQPRGTWFPSAFY